MTGKQEKAWLLAEIDKAIKSVKAKTEDDYTPPKQVAEMFEEAARLGEEYGRLRGSYVDAEECRQQANKLRNDTILLQPCVEFQVPGGTLYRVLPIKSVLADFRKRIARDYPTGPAPAYRPARSSCRTSPTTVPALPKSRPDRVEKYEMLLKHACSTDEKRKVFHDTHYDADAHEMVAADGKRLAVICEVDGGSKTTEHAEGVYPAYQRVVPEYRAGEVPNLILEGWHRMSISTEAYASKAALAGAILAGSVSNNQSNPAIGFYPDETTGELRLAQRSYPLKDYDNERGVYESSVGITGEAAFSLDVVFFRQAICFLRAMGNDTVTLAWQDALSPVLLLGEREYVILMPVREPNDDYIPEQRFERIRQRPKRRTITRAA